MKYEFPGDEGKFEAKGIETVRRDGCPAASKILEKSLKYGLSSLLRLYNGHRLFFADPDVSKLKKYVTEQMMKITTGHVSLQDFIIAQAVKLGSYRYCLLVRIIYLTSRSLPPGAQISIRKMKKDPRTQPQYGERVPFLVVYGGPKDRLKDQIVSPEEFLANPYVSFSNLYFLKK
jgi:DNA polymerase elongation subunit (family B)